MKSKVIDKQLPYDWTVCLWTPGWSGIDFNSKFIKRCHVDYNNILIYSLMRPQQTVQSNQSYGFVGKV